MNKRTSIGLRRRRGFTLVEILVSSAILVLVTTGVMSFYILLRKTWTRTAAQMTASISTAKAVDKIVYGRGNDPHGLRSATGASVWVWSNGTNWMLNYNSNSWIFYDAGSKTISTDTNGIICVNVLSATCSVSALGASIGFSVAEGAASYRITNAVETYVEFRN